MRRTLFTLATALSAVLCGGVCAMWVGSYRVGGDLRYQQAWASPGARPGRYTLTDRVLIFGSAAGTLRLGSGQEQWTGLENPGLPRGFDHGGSPWEYTRVGDPHSLQSLRPGSGWAGFPPNRTRLRP